MFRSPSATATPFGHLAPVTAHLPRCPSRLCLRRLGAQGRRPSSGVAGMGGGGGSRGRRGRGTAPVPGSPDGGSPHPLHVWHQALWHQALRAQQPGDPQFRHRSYDHDMKLSSTRSNTFAGSRRIRADCGKRRSNPPCSGPGTRRSPPGRAGRPRRGARSGGTPAPPRECPPHRGCRDRS